MVWGETGREGMHSYLYSTEAVIMKNLSAPCSLLGASVNFAWILMLLALLCFWFLELHSWEWILLSLKGLSWFHRKLSNLKSNERVQSITKPQAACKWRRLMGLSQEIPGGIRYNGQMRPRSGKVSTEGVIGQLYSVFQCLILPSQPQRGLVTCIWSHSRFSELISHSSLPHDLSDTRAASKTR